MTGFKAPSLYQLFSLYGSAALQPEKAKGWEVGLQQACWAAACNFPPHGLNAHAKPDRLRLLPHQRRLPAACYVPGTTTTRFGYYANVRRRRRMGWKRGPCAGPRPCQRQLQHRCRAGPHAGRTYGRQLARVPRHTANAELGYDFGHGISASAAARYSGRTFDSAGSAGLPDYWLVDLRAEWQVIQGLTLYGRAENLADRRYQTANGYGALGRSVYAGCGAASDAARGGRAPCVVVCSTCRHSPTARGCSGAARRRLLAAACGRQAESPDLAGVAVEEMPCLFACQRHCVVHIRAPGRIGYVLGGFAPDAASAQPSSILPPAMRKAPMARCPMPNGTKA
jgi:predicted metal-binding protein